MKSIFFKTAIFAIIGSFLFSCDKDFKELNVNPNAITTVVPEFLFTRAELAGAANYDYITLGGAMQHMANFNIGSGQGDKYIGLSGWQTGFFDNFYINEGIATQQVISSVTGDSSRTNELAEARIWRVYIFHRTTDLYGDIPYTEANRAYSDGIFRPKYDQQSFIYKDMLNELEEAVNDLDPTKRTFGSADLIYGGDIFKWRKFAYSLMLRLAMRLTKVDATTAETWVKKAIAGGVIINDDDLAKIQYQDGSLISNRNPLAQGLINSDYGTPQAVDNHLGGKLSKTLIDYLKNTNDPRLNALAVVWVNQSGTLVADTSSALQEGMQNGIWDHQPPDFGSYSEPNPATLLNFASPMLIFTSCESNLLLAEAAIRGWYAGDAEMAYNQAVQAGMKQWSLYGPAGFISDSRIASYLNQNPFKTTGSFDEKLEQISTQKWLALCFVDEYEVFANWRRTGYPSLIPTNYPGNLTGGTIPRRMVIGSGEESTNNENYKAAMVREGGADYDVLTNRVWWDVK